MDLVAPMPRTTSPWIRRDYLFTPSAAVVSDLMMLFPTGDRVTEKRHAWSSVPTYLGHAAPFMSLGPVASASQKHQSVDG
ncbi:hypothetical protein RB213_009955 [Colletotrichum asianum]